MFTLALQRRFEARHHLIGGDWGAENDPHAHSYLLELRLEGEGLNKHGYLVDLVDVESRVEQLLARFGGADLNSLSEFAGLNPSIEHFSRILCQALAEQHGVAVVPGAFFSPFGGPWIRFSYATPPERTIGAARRLLEGLDALAGG